MLKILSFVITVVLVFAGLNASASVVNLFGYPLGGEAIVGLKNCPSDSNKSKDICWLEKPYVAKSGDRLGAVYLPKPESRPEWATYVSSFQITLSKDRILKGLTVRTNDGYTNKFEIEKSIVSRFGSPKFSNLTESGTTSATWNTQEAYVHMLCSSSVWCSVEFRSPSHQIEVQKELDERELLKSKKPKF